MLEKYRLSVFMSWVIGATLFYSVPTWADVDHNDQGWNKPDKRISADSGKSLYSRLGGYDAIVAVTKEFIDRLAHDPTEGRFFVGLNDEHKAKVLQHVVEFLVVNTGGPGFYTGRDMKTTHKGLGITENDWNISVKHLIATLDKFKVPAKEKSELLAAVGPLKAQMVEKP